MTYSPIPLERFRGFDMRDSGDSNTDGALFALNLRVDDLSWFRSRAGYTELNGALLSTTDFPRGLKVKSDGKVVTVNSAKLRYFDPFDMSGPYTVTDLGTLTDYSGGMEELFGVMYLPRTTGPLGAFNGTAVTSTAGSPWGKFVAAMPNEARLAVGYSGLAGLQPMRVHFSTYDPVAATNSWGANDWVDIRPNDGGAIRAMVTWNDQLFVFKDSAFFVFGSSGTKPDGSAEFDFRAVDVGLGCMGDFCAVAGRDGVYFLSPNGLYRTTGGPPVKVSSAIDRLFSGEAPPEPPSFASVPPTPSSGTTRLQALPDGIYIVDYALPHATNVWVYSYTTGEFALWRHTHPLHAMVPFSIDGSYYFTSDRGALYRAAPSSTTDAGAAIPCSRMGSWVTIGDSPTVVREVEVAGMGSGPVEIRMAVDGLLALGTATDLTLGPAPNEATGWHRVATRGRELSVYVSANAPLQVNRMRCQARDTRAPGDS